MIVQAEANTVSLLQRLLTVGYVADPQRVLGELLKGLAHPCETGWVLSYRLLNQRQYLSNKQELVLACLGLLAPVRQAWSVILAARSKEAGLMPEQTILLQLISQLQAAADWVVEAMPQAQLAASPYAGIERELLGVSVEQAAATPMLARILAVCFNLHKFQTDSLPPLPVIDASGMQAGQNWLPGRLLALPGCYCEPSYILHGEALKAHDMTAVDWVLTSPWALLLAMLVYAQYNWAAEGRGGLVLELSAGQNAFQPNEIVVLVQDTEGDELKCGTLGDLLLRVLAHLQLFCFPQQPPAAQLNSLLAGLVGQVLNQQIWRYQDGASGENGQYRIHPQFADACYRLPANKVFNRSGRQLWIAIRTVAEQWRSEWRNTRMES